MTTAAPLGAKPKKSSNDYCDLAMDVAEKAAVAFKKDRTNGIRLFIKAYKLCPKDAAFAYNLGLAYYRYGRLEEAQKYMQQAVDMDGSRSKWLNNLAAVILQRGESPRQALVYAEKAAKLNKYSPAIQDTLARAKYAGGRYIEALTVIRKAKKKWPGNTKIAKSFSDIQERYLSHYLEEIKTGRVDEGLAGLKRADDDPRIVQIYCIVLSRLGKTNEALSEADRARRRFGKSSELEQAFDEIMDRTIRGFYLDFQKGRPAKAVQAAKKLSEQYTGESKLKKAYDELFNAYIADASKIEVPPPGKIKKGTRRPGRTEELLSSIGDSGKDIKERPDITVDVDENIPKGSLKRPYGVAVVIGNQRYAIQKRGISDVKYAERDAAVMKRYLMKLMGYEPENIIFRTNVTSGDLRNIFGSKGNPAGMLHNYVRAEESEVFIYYVGHGAPGPEGRTAYLVPVDAQVDYIANNGYPLDLFYQILDRLPAREITVVLDACFSGDSASGPLFKKISPAMLKSLRPVRKLANSVIFCGADKDQVVTWFTRKRHSLFTYFFLKGLGGDADRNRDKKITVGEMKKYLKKEVPYWASRESNRKQNPLVVGRGTAVLARLK